MPAMVDLRDASLRLVCAVVERGLGRGDRRLVRVDLTGGRIRRLVTAEAGLGGAHLRLRSTDLLGSAVVPTVATT